MPIVHMLILVGVTDYLIGDFHVNLGSVLVT